MSATLPITTNDRWITSTASIADQRDFAFDFPVQYATDVLVEVATAALPSVWTILSYDAGAYEVSGLDAAAGGIVHLAIGRSVGDLVRITGSSTLTRTSSVVRGGQFRSEAIDADFDRAMMIAQELRRDVNARNLVATPAADGLMSAVDKAKLDDIASGATANSDDAVLLSRGNHTGVQPIATVEGLADALASLTPLEDLRAYRSPDDVGDQDAVSRMYTAIGYVRIPAGECNLSTDITIGGDIYFDQGAYLIGAGILTFRDIYAPRDHIFRGAAPFATSGSYFKAAIYPEWWGAAGDGLPNFGALIATIAASMAARTEVTLELGEGGVYLVQTPFALPRGWYVRSPGQTRRGILKLDVAALAGADVITSVDDALRLEGMQIELSEGTYYPGRLVVASGANARIENVALPAARVGIAALGAAARIIGVYSSGAPLENGFATVAIGGLGSLVGAVIGVQASGSYVGSVLSIGAGITAGSVGSASIKDIIGTGAGGITVDVAAAGSLFIASCIIRGVLSRDGGTPVRLKNIGSSQIQYMQISDLQGGSGASGAYGVEIYSAGNINNIMIGAVDMRAGAYAVYVSEASHLGLLEMIGPFQGATAKFGTASIPANYVLRGRAICGYAEPVALSGNLDRTLDPLSLAATIVLTGTLTANRTVTLPTVSPWLRSETRSRVVNAMTGAFTISIGGLASLAPGAWVDVQWVGSAWVVVGSSSPVDVTATVGGVLAALPTTDPGIAGTAWLNGDVVCISSGA